MERVIKVDGMSCSHCKNAVEKAVRGLTGVTFANVDLAAKTLTLAYDQSMLTDALLKETIEDEGFSAVM